MILTAHARHEATTSINAAAGADVTLDEALVLGRAGESGGDMRSTLAVQRDDEPVLLTSIDTALPGWSGPAGTNGGHVVANRLSVRDRSDPERSTSRPQAAVLEVAEGCRLAVATAADMADARRSLDAVLPVCGAV